MNFMQTYILSTVSWPLNDVLHGYLSAIATFFITILEFMGLIILVNTAFKSFLGWLKKDPRTHLNLAEGLAMALSFKLGGEILRTVVVRDMSEIIQVGAIIVLRGFLTRLIHWEIKNDEAELRAHDEKARRNVHRKEQ